MKRAHPAQDLMTALIEARDEHDRLTKMELVIMGVSLLVAGHETTANQLNLCLLTLHEYPEELERLRARPETIPQAVEELMRFVQLGGGAGAGMPRVAPRTLSSAAYTSPPERP